jgi:hypothetical protein
MATSRPYRLRLAQHVHVKKHLSILVNGGTEQAQPATIGLATLSRQSRRWISVGFEKTHSIAAVAAAGTWPRTQ